MRKNLFRLLSVIVCCCIMIAFMAPVTVLGAKFPVRRPAPDQDNDPNDPNGAQNITSAKLVTDATGFGSLDYLFNLRKFTGLTTEGNASLTLEYADGIGYLYFIFLKEYGEYTVINNDTGDSVTCGTNNFLHEVTNRDKRIIFTHIFCKQSAFIYAEQNVPAREIRSLWSIELCTLK